MMLLKMTSKYFGYAILRAHAKRRKTIINN